MKEILWHGRGGQGAFTAARLLGAAFVRNESAFALAFPSFGPERRGAPIRAFTKLDLRPIGNRSEILKADYSVFLDDTLFSDTSLEEIKSGGTVLINTKRRFEDERIVALDGDAIAEKVLKQPITNTVMLGAFAALFDGISLSDVEEAIKEYMPPRLHEKNITAVRQSYEEVKEAKRR